MPDTLDADIKASNTDGIAASDSEPIGIIGTQNKRRVVIPDSALSGGAPARPRPQTRPQRPGNFRPGFNSNPARRAQPGQPAQQRNTDGVAPQMNSSDKQENLEEPAQEPQNSEIPAQPEQTAQPETPDSTQPIPPQDQPQSDTDENENGEAGDADSEEQQPQEKPEENKSKKNNFLNTLKAARAPGDAAKAAAGKALAEGLWDNILPTAGVSILGLEFYIFMGLVSRNVFWRQLSKWKRIAIVALDIAVVLAIILIIIITLKVACTGYIGFGIRVVSKVEHFFINTPDIGPVCNYVKSMGVDLSNLK